MQLEAVVVVLRAVMALVVIVVELRLVSMSALAVILTWILTWRVLLNNLAVVAYGFCCSAVVFG